MAWRTLYVTGKTGFDTTVLRYLERLDIHFLTGSFNADDTYLFWVTNHFVLQDFKKAIGSKIIFKYRMRFFFEVDAFLSSRDTGKRSHYFTTDQEAMFRELND
jgi:hypothetical protein